MIKRSISLYGHHTSVAREAEFWAVIDGHVSGGGDSFIRTRDDELMELSVIIKKAPNFGPR
ncbi:hypothetical protein GCM10009069_29410 [Algimonas arctica]|uniref:Ribbon-helix-helix domain-containing protein n=1 Tax=Algimonas arctica TaxID=1479486 RepID=A0A8J3CTQ4_9PROT|nr:ribbon-helix-helix domain-containing protein [Algimonas arctica]GHB04987.1 hypothetical protein GCM10009069_29410 [Algimonas arctica]